MNEQINTLWWNARIGYNDQNCDPEVIEKFAELIIKECMEVAIHKDDGMISTADIAGYMSSGRATAAKMIAKHFGVE